jgi:hypothetical protein
MTLKTRGSNAVDKAQRRLALLKSIDQNLDLGYGLTIAEYDRTITDTRTQLESYNTLLSKVQESRNTVAQMEKTLGEMSERMLTGVMTKYGKHSLEYTKAGGSTRKRGSQPAAPQAAPVAMMAAPAATTVESSNGTRNGKAPQPALS